jgi:CRISPR-associated endonuclease/helicase Cas3
LALSKKQKVIVVATSLIECGVDISFQVGYREKIGLLQREQFGGRVGRNEEFKDSRTFVFEFSDELKGREGDLTENPANAASIRVFDSLHPKQLTPKYCTHAVGLELEQRNNLGEDFIGLDKQGALQYIGEKYKVIANLTACILTDKTIVERMKRNEFIPPNEISYVTVQVWLNKLDGLLERGLVTKLSTVLEQEVIAGTGGDKYFNETDNDYFVWNGKYDPEFYGIGKALFGL